LFAVGEGSYICFRWVYGWISRNEGKGAETRSFRATGQTGISLNHRGEGTCPLDAVIADFMAGSIEYP